MKRDATCRYTLAGALIAVLTVSGCTGASETEQNAKAWYCLGLCVYAEAGNDVNSEGEVTNEK